MTPTSATRLPLTGRVASRPGNRAFTLLEVIVAIALLGLVAGLFISGGSELFRARDELFLALGSCVISALLFGPQLFQLLRDRRAQPGPA